MSTKKQGVERMNQLKKDAAVDKPGDLPKDTAEKSIVHILSPSPCWTTTIATTVPPDQQ
jgi:hypothetical protein